MAQRHSTPTVSILKVSDQRFAAGHESSPKNDISCSLTLLSAHRQLRTLRGESVCVESENTSEKVDTKPIDFFERLQHLKMFSRRKSPLQKEDEAKLKKQRFAETLKAQLPELTNRVFKHHEIYGLITELNALSSKQQWHIRENMQEVIVYTCYGSIFPGLRFQKQGDTCGCIEFSFNIRLAL